MRELIVPEGVTGEVSNSWGTFRILNGRISVPDDAVFEMRAAGYVVVGGLFDLLRERTSTLETKVEVIEQSGGSGGGSAPVRFEFTNAATWIQDHSFGRAPDVAVFLASGEKVTADVVSTPLNFTVVHAFPQTGFALVY